jgi:hypothetical protein
MTRGFGLFENKCLAEGVQIKMGHVVTRRDQFEDVGINRKKILSRVRCFVTNNNGFWI